MSLEVRVNPVTRLESNRYYLHCVIHDAFFNGTNFDKIHECIKLNGMRRHFTSTNGSLGSDERRSEALLEIHLSRVNLKYILAYEILRMILLFTLYADTMSFQ